MTTGMKIAVWVSLGMNVLAVVLMVTVIGALNNLGKAFEGAADKFEDAAAAAATRVENEKDLVRLFQRQVEALEESNELIASIDADSETFDVSNHIYPCEEGVELGCRSPNIRDVLAYMGDVAAGRVSGNTSTCIAFKYADYGPGTYSFLTYPLDVPMWGLSDEGGFGHMQAGSHIGLHLAVQRQIGDLPRYKCNRTTDTLPNLA